MSYLTDIVNKVDFDDNVAIQEFFIMFNVSNFDHYLTFDEYSDESLVCYSDIKNDPVKQACFDDIENKFIELYEGLYQLSESNVTILINGEKRERVSIGEYKEALSEAMKENPLCGFLFSNLGLYIMTGYDLTHSFYILKNKINLLDEINDMIRKAGLFILE